jgi:hypothetical protein
MDSVRHVMILGFGHRKRTGKDTLAKFVVSILREHEGYRGKNVSRRGFADHLYNTCYLLYSWAGFKRREYYEEYPEAKEAVLPALGKSPRQILIDVGCHLRLYDPPVWINAALRSDNADVIVVSDLRYPNEYQAIKEAGGYCFKVVRPSVKNTDDAADCALDKQPHWDDIVENSGTLKDLHNQARRIVEAFVLPCLR